MVLLCMKTTAPKADEWMMWAYQQTVPITETDRVRREALSILMGCTEAERRTAKGLKQRGL